MQSIFKNKFIHFIAPVLLVIILLVIWELSCALLHVSEHLLPAPSVILTALKKNFIKIILPDTIQSLKVMLSGYLIAIPLGFIIAAVASQFKFINRMFQPILIILMVTPMATLVPELKLFLGVSNYLKILVIVLQCTPVISVNSLSGFIHVPENKIDLMKGFGCGKSEQFMHVVLPNALPQIFTGLKLGCILCMIASMGADLSVGQGGLGYRISVLASFSATATAFAAIFVAAIVGVLFYQLIAFIESRIVTWNH
jgi:ABC-type nitrate/sulfonate/bicarbonate transport system permease component